MLPKSTCDPGDVGALEGDGDLIPLVGHRSAEVQKTACDRLLLVVTDEVRVEGALEVGLSAVSEESADHLQCLGGEPRLRAGGTCCQLAGGKLGRDALELGARLAERVFGDRDLVALRGDRAQMLVDPACAPVCPSARRPRARSASPVRLVVGLLGTDCSDQMTCELRWLRLHGPIVRNPGTNTHALTPEGIRTAVFYTKIHDPVLRPLVSATDSAVVCPPLRWPVLQESSREYRLL